jgi:hypothetical protein
VSADVARTNSEANHRAWLLSMPAPILVFSVMVLVSSACGGDPSGPTVASGGSATTQHLSSSANASSNSASANSSQSALAFPHCMHAHGVTNFPDQPTGGKYPTPQDLGISSRVFQTAYNDCKRLLPSSDTSPGPASPQVLNEVLKFARCMRSHGYPTWPDPTPTPSGPRPYTFKLLGVRGFDPRSPQVDATLNKCQRLTKLGLTGPPPFGLERPGP